MSSSTVCRALGRTACRANAHASTARQSVAALSTSGARRVAGDLGPDKTHVTDKRSGHKDPQSEASKVARDERDGKREAASGAISEADGADANKQAERESPSAPKPVIGMNDERGSKS